MNPGQAKFKSELPENGRMLSSEDISAIVDELESRIYSRFFNQLGHGLWDIFWKTIVVIVILVAAYGASRTH